MTSFIKKLLFKVLSQRAYLKILHRSFFLMYNAGVLKKDKSFKYHYMIRHLIAPNDTVVDIGDNLGYFSRNFARLASNGQLIAIEPVPAFYAVLYWAIGKYPNVKVFNYALGTEPGKVTMVLPESNGMIRTGLPHIATEEEKKQHKTIDVSLVKGSELLSGLDRFDYLKCDIEGFEIVVLPELREILVQHKPMIQIEIGEQNEAAMLAFFAELGYIQYGICDFKIVRENGKQQEQGDFLFVHKDKEQDFIRQMKSKQLMA